MAHPGPRALDGFSILVVDDDGDARELLEMYLVAAGATVTTASSAAEALERFNAFPPAVVVTDIAMPRLDGIWLLNAIRSLLSIAAQARGEKARLEILDDRRNAAAPAPPPAEP